MPVLWLTLLRQDLLDVMLAGVLIATGLASAALYRVGKRDHDRALLWFGLFAMFFGTRLLINTSIFRITFAETTPVWDYLEAAVTYVILLPAVLLLWEIFPAWRGILRWFLWALAAFALTGLTSDALQRAPHSLDTWNSLIVLASLLFLLVLVFRQKRGAPDLQTLRFGLLAFSFTVALNNLITLTLQKRHFNLEPLGLLALLVSLGLLLARRTFRNEERLVELDKELEVARRIQTSILPRKIPGKPHWDIATHYLPMTAVAGDFYDFLIVDEERAGILVADVSGHGVPAALIASMVKVAIAAQMPHAHAPERVLAGMNRTLCGNLQGQYVTAAYLYLDLKARKMRYAAAGHPALLWRHAGGEIEEVLENGLMLGLFPEASYTERECALQPDDYFLLYTDGVTEAADRAGEFFGEGRIKTALMDSHLQGAHQMVSTLADRVSRWTDSVQDDLTLVAVGWNSAD